MAKMVKTGECYFRDEAGALWLAESFIDDKGCVSTQQTGIEPAPSPAGPANAPTQES